MRRCRPLLGTLVEITAHGSADDELSCAIEAAFREIARVQKCMSAHDAQSELSRLNREAAKRPVAVSEMLFEVLRRAEQMSVESNGAFDFTVAPTLAKWGFLPGRLRHKGFGNWRDVLLLRGRKVRFVGPVAIDLGGIAKGFAIDRAIETLKNSGVEQGIVNAGGDLRVFGDNAEEIFVRHPESPGAFGQTLLLRNAALATSSPYFTQKKVRGKLVSHLVQSRVGGAVTGQISVTVEAAECWLADALTKVVLNARHEAERILARYSAKAMVMTA